MLVVQESSYTKENDGLVFEGRLGVLGDHWCTTIKLEERDKEDLQVYNCNSILIFVCTP